ncbi:MAG: hypothetical protein U0835_16920 [Isosphaeraceae bacterium]
MRIARRQPKFDFDPATRKSSKLYTGFDNPDEETAERGRPAPCSSAWAPRTRPSRDGFPETAEELFRYHAVILDDLEAAFFCQDQAHAFARFVSQRGGGLLMLGGPDSFSDSRYDRARPSARSSPSTSTARP